MRPAPRPRASGRAPLRGVIASASGSADRGARIAYSYRIDPAVPQFPDDHPIIVFDGYCVLCSGWVRFILAHDRHALYRLLPAQSAIGHALYVHYGLDPENYETYMLIENGTAYFKSEATIRMAQSLGLPWSAAGVIRPLPARLRDRIYDWVARNRFRVFSRRDACYRPEGRYAGRFLA
jgi:predicted DCC family thiol-disulfide oxidoreductase YuxK